MESLREMLTNQLQSLPGIEVRVWPDHTGFVSFEYNGKGIAHFDSDTELDIRLTKKEILREGLEHPKNSTNHPNRYRSKPHWIVVPFKQESQVKEIVRLVKLAIEQR